MKKPALLSLGFLLFPPFLGAQTPDPEPAASPLARAVVTTAVEAREPVDSVTTLATDTDRIYYFTEIRGMGGQSVIHRWEYGDQVMAEITFPINGPRWRIYSSKNLKPDWTGEWKVSVLDAEGRTLGVNTFAYEPASEAPEASGALPQVDQQQ